MTLLELVVAMAVGLLVVAVASRAVLQSRDARARVQAESGRLAAARSALLLLMREIEQTSPGDLRLARRSRSEASHLHASVDVPQPLLVSYRVLEATLLRRERLRFAAHDDSEEIPLLGGVRVFDVRCLADGEWHAAWDRPALPEACRIRLELQDDVRLATLVVPVTGGRR